MGRIQCSEGANHHQFESGAQFCKRRSVKPMQKIEGCTLKAVPCFQQAVKYLIGFIWVADRFVC